MGEIDDNGSLQNRLKFSCNVGGKIVADYVLNGRKYLNDGNSLLPA